MSRLRLVLVSALAAATALLATASSLRQGGDVIVIRPGSGEVTITQGQRVSAQLYRAGWLSCSPGMDLDYRNAAISYMELWRDGQLLQTVQTENGKWSTSPAGSDPLCVHVNSPYISNWRFDHLKVHTPGDYELRWSRGWSVALSDGYDYEPSDGYPDLYPPTSDQFVVKIHVVSPPAQ